MSRRDPRPFRSTSKFYSYLRHAPRRKADNLTCRSTRLSSSTTTLLKSPPSVKQLCSKSFTSILRSPVLSLVRIKILKIVLSRNTSGSYSKYAKSPFQYRRTAHKARRSLLVWLPLICCLSSIFQSGDSPLMMRRAPHSALRVPLVEPVCQPVFLAHIVEAD